MLVRVARFYSGWSRAELESLTWRRLVWWDEQAERFAVKAMGGRDGGE